LLKPNGVLLTVRETKVLQLVAEGQVNKQVAATLGISIKTVEKHRLNAKEKLNIHETADLIRYAS
jgi:DNA-binding CsgD family transcriptional regulator